jgi:predicted dehydrogenase
MPDGNIFTILGAGFGMYGYLPALIEGGSRVVLPERYRSIIASRPELTQYVANVDWCENTEAALARADAAVVALRPADQAEWIPRLASIPGISRVILEKPVAPTPELSGALLQELGQAGKRFRVGYTFRFLAWAEPLRQAFQSSAKQIELDWTFLAHHYRADLENWKRFDASGGGALRFYGIHLIALFAELGLNDVAVSTLSGPSEAETSAWKAILTGPKVCPVWISLDTREATSRFRIIVRGGQRDGEVIVDQPDPFSATKLADVYVRDPRVDVLAHLLRAFNGADAADAVRQRAILALWTRIEGKSQRLATPAL